MILTSFVKHFAISVDEQLCIKASVNSSYSLLALELYVVFFFLGSVAWAYVHCALNV